MSLPGVVYIQRGSDTKNRVKESLCLFGKKEIR